MLSLTDVVQADGHWDGPGPWFALIPLLWFAFFVTMAVIFARGGRRRWARRGVCSGEQRLAERFAAGEIDAAEYRERLGVLREGRS